MVLIKGLEGGIWKALFIPRKKVKKGFLPNQGVLKGVKLNLIKVLRKGGTNYLVFPGKGLAIGKAGLNWEGIFGVISTH